jgi:hypothetical protein
MTGTERQRPTEHEANVDALHDDSLCRKRKKNAAPSDSGNTIDTLSDFADTATPCGAGLTVSPPREHV